MSLIDNGSNEPSAISAPCVFGGCTAIAHSPVDWPMSRERDYLCDEHGPLLAEFAHELVALVTELETS